MSCKEPVKKASRKANGEAWHGSDAHDYWQAVL